MKRMTFAIAVFATGILADVAPPPAAAQPPRGSFQQSCRSVRERAGILTAQCRDERGRWRETSLRYRDCRGDIGNNNGQLVCAGRPGGPGGPGGPGWGGSRPGGPGAGRMPGGTWARTCTNASMRGSILSARCDNGRGRRVDARLDMRSCRGDAVTNRFGQLVCN